MPLLDGYRKTFGKQRINPPVKIDEGAIISPRHEHMNNISRYAGLYWVRVDINTSVERDMYERWTYFHTFPRNESRFPCVLKGFNHDTQQWENTGYNGFNLRAVSINPAAFGIPLCRS